MQDAGTKIEELNAVIGRIQSARNNPYVVLDMKAWPRPSEKDILRAWKKLSLLIHPDKCDHPGADEAMRSANMAKAELLKRVPAPAAAAFPAQPQWAAKPAAAPWAKPKSQAKAASANPSAPASGSASSPVDVEGPLPKRPKTGAGVSAGAGGSATESRSPVAEAKACAERQKAKEGAEKARQRAANNEAARQKAVQAAERAAKAKRAKEEEQNARRNEREKSRAARMDRAAGSDGDGADSTQGNSRAALPKHARRAPPARVPNAVSHGLSRDACFRVVQWAKDLKQKMVNGQRGAVEHQTVIRSSSSTQSGPSPRRSPLAPLPALSYSAGALRPRAAPVEDLQRTYASGPLGSMVSRFLRQTAG